MNITKLKLTLVGICGLILVPTISHASSATFINDSTALFTIDFAFSDELFEVQVPIAAEFGVDYLDRVDTVGYKLESEAETLPEISMINALILSRAAIVDNKYLVPQGTTGEFTLLILATFTNKITEELQASITKLPYYLDEHRTTVHQNQLDELNRPTLNQ